MNPLQQLIEKPRRLAMEAFAKELLESMGSQLPEGDQEWLKAHLQGLPDYLRTPEGGEVMAAVVACYKHALAPKLEW